MCGIAGLYQTRDDRPIDAALLARMTAAIAHRGPDGEGFHLEPGLGLGHRRLSIIDLAGGAQPMFEHDRGLALVFNGEIYNFRELKADLEARGHRFATRSDTEVILKAWAEWGEAAVTRFKGMFAFALWDGRARTLFLARDPLGKKPVHYAELSDGTLLFGSEIKALRVHGGVDTRIDPCAVDDYFALGYVPDPRTIFRGIAKLPPGTMLVARKGAPVRIDRYWRPSALSPPTDFGSAVAAVRAGLDAAVERRLVADVPLGAFLSGGLDSSAVVAHMAGLMREPVKTFSIGFGDAATDETPYAAEVARRFGTEHSVRTVAPDDFDLIDRLAGIFDEPFGDNSALPSLQVCAAAREKVTVALSGDGGDELFGGYRRYAFHMREEALRRRLPLGLRRAVFGPLGAAYPKLDWAPRLLRAKTTFEELGLDEAEALFRTVSIMGEPERRRLFSPDQTRAVADFRPSDRFAALLREVETDDPLARAQHVDLTTWLAGDILTKVDRVSMAVSLEVRAPLLDVDLLALGLGLPAAYKIRAASGKAVLKEAMRGVLPDDVLDRRKQGFSMPMASWFRGPLRGRIEAMAGKGGLERTGLFEERELERLVRDHVSGTRNHDRPLWLLLMFDAFARRA